MTEDVTSLAVDGDGGHVRRSSSDGLCCSSIFRHNRSEGAPKTYIGAAAANDDNNDNNSIDDSSSNTTTVGDHRIREQPKLYNCRSISIIGRRPTPLSLSASASVLRYGPTFSRQTTIGSSLAAFEDSMTEIRIEDIQNEHEPTSAILDYCKRKFLRPYVAILTLVGLNPISTETTFCRACLSYMHAVLVISVLCLGYFLQYLTSYRGDRGFGTTTNRKIIPQGTVYFAAARTVGELLFGYVIPNALHLMGYVSAIVVCKIIDQEELQNLIERVFLMSMKPRRLCMMLWLNVFLGFAFLIILFGYVVPSVWMQSHIVKVSWLIGPLQDYQAATKIVLLVAIFIQDLVEIVILTSYCIECYLLRVHLSTLSHKLLMHSIESLDWMRDVLEFRKLLDHLNNRVAVPVCFFIVMNLSYGFAGVVYLFKDFDFHYSAIKVVVLNIINVCLWMVMGLVPFFMASSVTRVCQTAQANGHHIRVRPFLYHNTSSDDLNSTLLFASSLDMSAKLFRMPIQQNYLCFAIVIVSIVVLTLGMCLNLSALGSF